MLSNYKDKIILSTYEKDVFLGEIDAWYETDNGLGEDDELYEEYNACAVKIHKIISNVSETLLEFGDNPLRSAVENSQIDISV